MLFKKYLHIVHNLQAMKRIFSKLFLCMCKDMNLAEKFKNFAKVRKKEKKKKLNSTEFVEFVYYKSSVYTSLYTALVSPSVV